MTDARQLADDYFDFRQSTEGLRLLRLGQTTHLDRWEDLTPTSIAERQTTLEGFADAAEALLTSAEPDNRVLLETVAFTARSAARLLDWRVEHTLVNPAMGLHATLLTFIGRFSLVTAEHGVEYHTKTAARAAPRAQRQTHCVSRARQRRSHPTPARQR